MAVKKIRSMKDLESLPEGEWVEAEFEKGVFKIVDKLQVKYASDVEVKRAFRESLKRNKKLLEELSKL